MSAEKKPETNGGKAETTTKGNPPPIIVKGIPPVETHTQATETKRHRDIQAHDKPKK